MPTTTRESTWDARIARARELASTRPAARDLLMFYAALAEYQRGLGASVGDAETFDVERVVEAIPDFLDWLRRNGRSELVASVEIDAVASAFRLKSSDSHSLPAKAGSHAYAESMASAFSSKNVVKTSEGMPSGFSRTDATTTSEGVASGFSRTDAAKTSEGVASGFSRKAAAVVENPATLFIIESLLQAFAEHLRNSDASTPGAPPMRCPRCSALPVAAVLREEGHGAKRSLLCAICLHEWECLRLVCPACGEQDFDKLPVYTAEQFAHVRIDGCDSCHHYIKTIDLTKDGLAVPCVDDIASVSLDLWARERGYSRVKANLLGV
jgi:formate dehydrogenase maturation protein FdhE